MNKYLVIVAVFLFIGGIFSVYAQDMIVLKDGNIIDAKVLEISPTEIRYKRFNHLDGPTIVVSIVDVLSIRYENGTSEIFNTNITAGQENAQIITTASQKSKKGETETSYKIFEAASELLLSQNGEIKVDELLTGLGRNFPGLKKETLLAIQRNIIWFNYQDDSYFINCTMAPGGRASGNTIITDIISVLRSQIETETSQAIYQAASDLVLQSGTINAGTLISELGKKFPGLRKQRLAAISINSITVNYQDETYFIRCIMDLDSADAVGGTAGPVSTVGDNTIVKSITSVNERVEPEKSSKSEKTATDRNKNEGGKFALGVNVGPQFCLTISENSKGNRGLYTSIYGAYSFTPLFSLQSGVAFSFNNGWLSILDDGTIQDVKFNVIDIPILSTFTFYPSQNLLIRLSIGPLFSFSLSDSFKVQYSDSSIESDHNIDKFSFGASLGIGFGYKIGF
jgi:hypothetical protein